MICIYFKRVTLAAVSSWYGSKGGGGRPGKRLRQMVVWSREMAVEVVRSGQSLDRV